MSTPMVAIDRAPRFTVQAKHRGRWINWLNVTDFAKGVNSCHVRAVVYRGVSFRLLEDGRVVYRIPAQPKDRS